MNAESLSLSAVLRLSWDVVRLDRAAIDKARGPAVGLGFVLLVVALAGAVGGFWEGPAAVLGYGVWRVLQHLFVVAVVHFLATVFGERGSFEGLFKALGLGSVVQVVGIVPLGGLVATVWYFFILVRVMEQVYGMDAGKAVVIALFPAFLVIAGTVMLFFGLITLGALTGI